jgi:nitrite reductase (cytochrome c-552)
MLERDPRLAVLWAGYAFSKDYNQGRGHFHSIEDIRQTLRTNPITAATCWTCKSPDVVRLMDQMGPEAFYAGKWVDLGGEIAHPIGCLDCHDPKTMNLKITRPALKEAFERQGKDITKATHQEMRTLVCAQCHVEYYFQGKGNYLTFPWDQGKSVEEAEAYFDEINFSDWQHQLSKTPMLKAQHPDYELWEKGIHAQRGVACADCHMPYRTEGGIKFTDHKIQSPLANIANSCQVCHREDEETLRQSVFERQDKIREIRINAEDALVKAHIEAKAAWDAGATEEEMKPVLQLIRHAQWRWDYTAASHGASFHAPLEVARILGTSVEKAQEARLLLARVLAAHNVAQPVTIPDLTTKEKAQAYIGLDMNALAEEKRKFLETFVSQWDK